MVKIADLTRFRRDNYSTEIRNKTGTRLPMIYDVRNSVRTAARNNAIKKSADVISLKIVADQVDFKPESLTPIRTR